MTPNENAFHTRTVHVTARLHVTHCNHLAWRSNMASFDLRSHAANLPGPNQLVIPQCTYPKLGTLSRIGRYQITAHNTHSTPHIQICHFTPHIYMTHPTGDPTLHPSELCDRVWHHSTWHLTTKTYMETLNWTSDTALVS